jgi:PKD repeat protein
VGIPLNIEPASVFAAPITILIPIPVAVPVDTNGDGVDDSGLEDYQIYSYTAEPSVLWRNAADVPGWLVPDSRVDRYDTIPPSIEMSVNRSGGIQIGYECLPPYAAFASETSQADVGQDVAFVDQSMGSITARLWNFGDGMTSTERDPVHAYSGAGEYDVTLTVTGPCGSDTVVSRISVTACEGIQLVSPADGTILRGKPTCTWEPGCNTEFVVEFSYDDDFAVVGGASLVMTTSRYKPPGRVLKGFPRNTPIYWRVRGVDAGIETVSEIWEFQKR